MEFSKNFIGCLLILLIISLYSFYSHTYHGHLDLRIINEGWSVLPFVNSVLHPENFMQDFPGGGTTAGESLFVWIYVLSEKIDIDAYFLNNLMIFLEIFVLISSYVFFAKALNNKRISFVSIIILSIMMVLSWVRASNFAQFMFPYFHGQFYGYAEGLTIIAIAFYLQQQYTLSSLLFIISFAIHPIITLSGFAFILPSLILNYKKKSILFSYAFFGMFAIFWYEFWLKGGAIELMSKEEFFQYAPLFNCHWFPKYLGIFNQYAMTFVAPYFSSCLMFLAILNRKDSFLKEEFKIKLLLGIGFLTILSLLNCLLADLEFSPFFVKLCFQRSTMFVLSISLVLLSLQIYNDMEKRNSFFLILSVLILARCFMRDMTWPYLICLVYAFGSFLENNQKTLYNSVLKISFILIILFLIYLKIGLGIFMLFKKQVIWLLFAGLLFVFLKILDKKMGKSNVSINLYKLLIIIIFVGGGIYWTEKNRKFSEEYIVKLKDYKDAMIWAKENTSNDALFIISPDANDGWRDFSERSEYGTMQEWYKTAWLYSGNKKIFNLGLKRGNDFLNGESILNRDSQLAKDYLAGSFLYVEKAMKLFYEKDGILLRKIIQNNNIDYVVMDKEKAKKYGGIPNWTAVFENSYYVILTIK